MHTRLHVEGLNSSEITFDWPVIWDQKWTHSYIRIDSYTRSSNVRRSRTKPLRSEILGLRYFCNIRFFLYSSFFLFCDMATLKRRLI